MRDLGRAYVKTHDYKKASIYYDECINNFVDINNSNIISYYEIATDYINILYKLSENDNNTNTLLSKLEYFINKLTNDIKNNDNYLLRKMLSYFKLIISRIFNNLHLSDKIRDTGEILNNLNEASNQSKEVIMKLKELKYEDSLKEEKEFISNIFYEIGKFHELIDQKSDLAEKAYIESIKNCEANEKYSYL